MFIVVKYVIGVTYIFAFNISSTEFKLYLTMRIIAELKLCSFVMQVVQSFLPLVIIIVPRQQYLSIVL